MAPRFLVLFFIVSPLFAQQEQIDYLNERLMLQQARFPENYEARQQARRAIEASSFEAVDMPARMYEQINSKSMVEVSVRKDAETFNIIFANEIMSEMETSFLAYNRGNYIFRKDILTGKIQNIRIFLQTGVGSYIDIRPDQNNRASMNIFLFNRPVYRNVRVPLLFEAIATSPFARLMSATKDSVDWKALINGPDWQAWQTVASMSAKIRPFLSLLQSRDTEDGAQDAEGNFVFINDGVLQTARNGSKGFNCSGFVKWVADGVYSQLENGRLLPINIIKKAPPPENRAGGLPSLNYTERDPFFGLDWTRNIAYELTKARYPHKRLRFGYNDVKDIPYAGFIPDVGYALSNLEMILYTEAIKHPGNFYLGSISTEFGQTPTLRQHVHTAVFFPYFNEKGEFIIEMYERNRETTPDSLRERYIGGYVFLSRVEATDNFKLPAV
jgi:hypothetical protein